MAENRITSSGAEEHDVTCEEWREYDFSGRVYRITSPKTVWFRKDGTTHRVVDSENIVHCLPYPGVNGCVLRWKTKDSAQPVRF